MGNSPQRIDSADQRAHDLGEQLGHRVERLSAHGEAQVPDGLRALLRLAREGAVEVEKDVAHGAELLADVDPRLLDHRQEVLGVDALARLQQGDALYDVLSKLLRELVVELLGVLVQTQVLHRLSSQDKVRRTQTSLDYIAFNSPGRAPPC